MKWLLTFLLVTILTTGFSQSTDLIPFNDSVNHFTIGVPKGWKYGTNKAFPAIKLIAMRASTGAGDTPHENYNVNIIKKENSSLDREYTKLIDALTSTNDFKLLEKGDITIHDQPYKWFIETHTNPGNAAAEHNYVFIAYKDGKTYIATFVTESKYFDTYRSLFHQIAESLVL